MVPAPVQRFFASKQQEALVFESRKTLEIFQKRSEAEIQKHVKQRVNRTVKQRMERINKQIQLNKVSENYQQEIQQLFQPIDSITFADFFKPALTYPIVGVKQVSIYKYPNSNSVFKVLVSQSTTYA